MTTKEKKHNVFDRNCQERNPGTVAMRRGHCCINCLIDEQWRQRKRKPG